MLVKSLGLLKASLRLSTFMQLTFDFINLLNFTLNNFILIFSNRFKFRSYLFTLFLWFNELFAKFFYLTMIEELLICHVMWNLNKMLHKWTESLVKFIQIVQGMLDILDEIKIEFNVHRCQHLIDLIQSGF